jgi:hypothetical protein
MKIVDAMEIGRAIVLSTHGPVTRDAPQYKRSAYELPIFDATEVHSLLDPDVDNGTENLVVDGIKFSLPFDGMVIVDRFANKEELNGTEFAILACQVASDIEGPYSLQFRATFPGAASFIRADVLCLPKDHKLPIVLGSGMLGIDENMTLIKANSIAITDYKRPTGKWNDYVTVMMDRNIDPEAIEGQRSAIVQEISGLLFMIALLNCKNVSASLSPYPITKPTLKWGKSKQPKGKRYYVLDIEPMRRLMKHEFQGGQITTAKALHLCRGHFKNFDDKPLFGKLKGTYWWQPHVRGAAEAGVVDKDYRIKLEAKAMPSTDPPPPKETA